MSVQKILTVVAVAMLSTDCPTPLLLLTENVEASAWCRLAKHQQ
ncbi:hypothetical protein ACOBQX_02900 [Actinokineospora sp. G85]